MRDLADRSDLATRSLPSGGNIVTLRSLRPSGTAEELRTLSNAMPICRIHVPPAAAPQQQEKVRLSHYIVTRRTPPRAANDNRRTRSRRAWPWVAAIAVAPTLTVVAMLSGLF
ncbi:hypothetical protein [Methylobacterium haplocladii]|nr:hypothetical protein [Methylobacterium haplocladii]